MIQVLIADTSAVVRSVLKEIILKTNKLEFTGEAVSCESMKFLAQKIKPDLIITNKSLFEFERSSALYDYCHVTEIPTIIYHAPGDKPYYDAKLVVYQELPEFISFSSQKIEEYSAFLEQLALDMKCSVLFEKHPATAGAIKEDGTITPALQSLSKEYSERNYQAVLVGVSTGGPNALLEFLKGIGRNFPLPIFITQHIDSFFDKNLINWLSSEAHVPVHLAEDNIKPLAGHVYFAPSDVHLTFMSYADDGFRMILNHDAPLNFLRPAVDKMFASAAMVFGRNCIAVLLTGMGADGAKECFHLKQLGAYTITQDESSCVIYGMPKVAYELGGSCEVLPLKQIPERLWSLTQKENKEGISL